MKVIMFFTFLALFVFVTYPAFFEKEDLESILSRSLAERGLDHTRENVQYVVNSKNGTIRIINKK